MALTKEIIKQREDKLEIARQKLKHDFIGIDNIIDDFINNIKIWYVTPELRTQPLIINLWGITGVGKTDLIRKFVKYVNMNEVFTEIQMDSSDGTANIEDFLDSTLDNATEHGILLLDEFQRFRTIDENGEDVRSGKFQDLWMLLSDGKLQSNASIKKALTQMIIEDKYWSERDDDDEDKSVKKKYNTSWWEASKMKSLLKLSDSVENIMTWDELTKMNVIKTSLKNEEIYEGKKYNKLLIIISGNLDEAFTIATKVSDADRDADIYHAYSKSIDIVKIKRALNSRFKPEQIGRLGNIHLIYPIPNKKSYEAIIKQKINNLIINVKEEFGINIVINKSIHKLIYENGVFPTQGVRPLISTISSILENSLPYFIYEYLKNGCEGDLILNRSKNILFTTLNGVKYKHKVPTVLDDIKDKQSENQKHLVAVHEAGHAILYAMLFKTVPTEIVGNTSDIETGGYIGTHEYIGTKIQYLNDIRISFGGRIAETLIFGGDYISSGASSDYEYATSLASTYVRDLGFTSENIGTYAPLPKNSGDYKVSIEETDSIIENMLKKLYEETVVLLSNKMEFLIELSNYLIKNSEIEPIMFKNMAKKYLGYDVAIINSSDVIEVDYASLFKNKLNSYKSI